MQVVARSCLSMQRAPKRHLASNRRRQNIFQRENLVSFEPPLRVEVSLFFARGIYNWPKLSFSEVINYLFFFGFILFIRRILFYLHWMSPDSVMGLDSNFGSLSSWSAHRRLSLTPARLRLKEERKKIIRALETKYRSIDDHERGMRKFVLIKNNLRRLQREAREEKLARHRAGWSGSRASNLSPSCLSATSRPRSPSPDCFDDQDCPSKRPRLLFDEDKENEMDDEPKAQPSPAYGTMDNSRHVDDAQEILRDLYETCVNDSVSHHQKMDSTFSDSLEDSSTISLSASCSVTPTSISSDNTDNNSDCWPRHSHYPFNCGQSSLLGNDLQSVVFHSLITSLES